MIDFRKEDGRFIKDEQYHEMSLYEAAHYRYEYRDGKLYHKNNVLTVAKKGDCVTRVNNKGYVVVGLKGKQYLAHRIVFLMHHGYLPKVTDHVDGGKTNNRIENLRECSYSQNNCNTTLRKDNKSGHKGVFFRKDTNKWSARINYNGVDKSLGCFLNKEDAVEAYRKAADELHKEFANYAA
jgi:hypothetical protein